MAITPKQAEKQTPGEARETKRLESIIDAHLQATTPDYRGGRWYELPPEVPEKVVGALAEMYGAAGWKVTREKGDQREPCNALYFVPADRARQYAE